MSTCLFSKAVWSAEVFSWSSKVVLRSHEVYFRSSNVFHGGTNLLYGTTNQCRRNWNSIALLCCVQAVLHGIFAGLQNAFAERWSGLLGLPNVSVKPRSCFLNSKFAQQSFEFSWQISNLHRSARLCLKLLRSGFMDLWICSSNSEVFPKSSELELLHPKFAWQRSIFPTQSSIFAPWYIVIAAYSSILFSMWYNLFYGHPKLFRRC